MRVEVTIRGLKLIGSSGPRYSVEERRRRADEIYAQIKDKVDPGNKGRILAIDIETGEYEVDDSEIAAVDRLYARIDDPQFQIYRIGYKYAHRLGVLRRRSIHD